MAVTTNSSCRQDFVTQDRHDSELVGTERDRSMGHNTAKHDDRVSGLKDNAHGISFRLRPDRGKGLMHARRIEIEGSTDAGSNAQIL